MDFVSAARAASLAGVLDIARQATHQVTSAARTSQATADGMPGIARVYASELLDKNTCDPCAGVDGKEYATVDAAHVDYREHGGFRNCGGGLRCRGTLVFVFDTETPSGVVPPATPPVPAGPLSLDEVSRITHPIESLDRYAPDDEWLDAIYQRQGFHAQPHANPDPEGVTLFRGVEGDTSEETSRFVQEFVNGPRHFPGKGVHGSGTYTSVLRDTAKTYSGRDRYGNPEGVIEMVLDSDARVTETATELRAALTRQVQEARAVAERARDWGEVERLDHLLDVVDDEGRAAAIMGYDAIKIGHVPRRNDTYYVLLNRGKVAIRGTE